MTDECNQRIDPTAFGLFFVAVVSLPIAISCFLNYMGNEDTVAKDLGGLLKVCSFFIAAAALGSYLSNSNFGFIVFGLVAAGVYFAGAYGGDLWINVTLGILYLVTLVWSFRLGNLKLLTMILLTTALIFIFGGVAVHDGDSDSIWMLLKGIAAIANFGLTLYLAYALVDEKVPSF